MKEWIIDNTTVTEERYDSLLNSSLIKSNLYKKIKDNTKYTIIHTHPFYRIGVFTYKKPTKLRCSIYGIRKNKNYYVYKDIKFKVLSETLFEKKDPYKKLLYSKKRIGTCISKSLDIGSNIRGSKIMIAICDEPFINPTKKLLHAFVIYEKNEKEYVVDGTFNIIMEKEIFFKLYNANIISQIESEKVVEDINLITKLDIDMYMFEYFCFRDEIMEGVKKYIKTR